MGCGSSNMVAVGPTADQNKPAVNNNNNQTGEIRQKRVGSAVSRSSKDSGVEDDVRSEVTSIRTQSGVSRRTLSSLKPSSARVRPAECEGDVLKKLREEGLITTEAHKAKSGVSFDVMEDNSKHPPRRLPTRLAKLEKRKKKVKLITQQDIQEKLEQAEQRRKEAETERINKIHSLTVKSDITTALDAFAERQKEVDVQTTQKVDHAAENREKKLRELRAKLRAKEEHAAKVRQRKLEAAKHQQENQKNIDPQTDSAMTETDAIQS